jgi:carboxypeptidase T
MHRRSLLSTASLVIAACFSQAASADDNHPARVYQLLEQEKTVNNIYKAYFPSKEIARKAAISFHAQLLEANYDEGYLVFELTPEEITQLKRFGFSFKPATEFMQQRKEFLENMQREMQSRQSNSALSTDAAGNVVSPASIPNYSCYETVEETFNIAQGFVNSKPNIATWIDVGNSWQKQAGQGGYDIRVLKLTNSAITGNKPKLFVNSAIHAREYTTAPLNLEFARWLVNGYGTNANATWILDHHEIHLMLHTNPDGRKQAENGLSWRKNTNTSYCGATSNNRGVDLNRNFSFSWNATGGSGSSGNQCDLTYRGPSPASEPETQAIESYVRSLWPDRRGSGLSDAAPADTSGIHIDVHSYSQLVLWPWGTTSAAAPNGTALQTLGRKFAYFNNYTPQQSVGLYPTDGTSDSVSYGELGVAAFTFELGTSFFQSCTTYNDVIKPENLRALIYAARVVRTPYITPAGPDTISAALSNNASSTGVQRGTQVTLSAQANDTRYNNSNGTEPTQNIQQAEYYIDTPPWLPNATAIALQPTDGVFNTKTENLTGSINTGNLSVGKHIVFVRSRDVSGTWGPFSAVFLNVNAN